MPLLNTREACSFFADHNIDMSKDQIIELARNKTLKNQFYPGKGYYFPESTLKIYVEELGMKEESSDSNDSWLNTVASQFRRFRRLRLKWYRKRGVKEYAPLLSVAFFCFALAAIALFFGKNAEGLYHPATVHISFVMVAIATTLILRVLLDEIATTTIKTAFISVQGTLAVFVGVLVALNYYYSETSPVFENYSSLISNQETWEKSKLELEGYGRAHKDFATGLPDLFDSPNIQVPMEMMLSIACFDEGSRFDYTFVHSRQVKKDGYTAVKQGTSLNKVAPLDLPFSRGDFLIFKGNSTSGNLIAAVTANNASLFKPEITVQLTGNSLCENPVSDPITADSLRADIVSLSRRNYDFHDHHKTIYMLSERIDATTNEKDIYQIGDLLVSMLDNGNEIIENISLDILSSTGRYLTVSKYEQSTKLINEQIQNLENGQTDKERFQKVRLEAALAGIRKTDYSCQLAESRNLNQWKTYRTCLTDIKDEGVSDSVIYKILTADTRIAMLENNTNGLVTASSKLLAFGEKAKNGVKRAEPSRGGLGRLSSDALVLSSLGYIYSGDADRAYEALSIVDESIDSEVELHRFEEVLEVLGKRNLKTSLIQQALHTAYLSSIKQKDRPELFKKIIDDSVTLHFTTGYQLFVHTETGSEDEAVRVAADIHRSLNDENDAVVTKFPILSKREIYNATNFVKGGQDVFNVHVAPLELKNSFTLNDACIIQNALKKYVAHEVKIGGPSSASCSV